MCSMFVGQTSDELGVAGLLVRHVLSWVCYRFIGLIIDEFGVLQVYWSNM